MKQAERLLRDATKRQEQLKAQMHHFEEEAQQLRLALMSGQGLANDHRSTVVDQALQQRILGLETKLHAQDQRRWNEEQLLREAELDKDHLRQQLAETNRELHLHLRKLTNEVAKLRAREESKAVVEACKSK
jgi:hypothetical protein